MAIESVAGPRPRGPLGNLRALEHSVAAALQPYLLLVIRLVFGYGMLRAGWGKIGNLEMVAGFFDQLGIPAPGFNAVLVAILELAGGGLLMLGLLSRVTAAVLIPVMVVAAATAHGAELAQLLSDPGVAIAAAPVPFLAALLTIGLLGGGRLSLDRVLDRASGRASGE